MPQWHLLDWWAVALTTLSLVLVFRYRLGLLRVIGVAAASGLLLWALGRLSARPTFATDIGEALDEAGLLGDGSIAGAKKAVDEATLRDERTIGEGEAAYRKTRGMAKETDEPEKIFAEVAAHHLNWVLEEDEAWDSDSDD